LAIGSESNIIVGVDDSASSKFPKPVGKFSICFTYYLKKKKEKRKKKRKEKKRKEIKINCIPILLCHFLFVGREKIKRVFK